jgi:L-threonine-O-3-phosphate decarboxylase
VPPQPDSAATSLSVTITSAWQDEKAPNGKSMTEHGGNIQKLAERSGLSEEEILDFSANINPLGPPEWIRTTISRCLDKVSHYPDPDSTRYVQAVAEHHQIGLDQVVPGNGTSQIIFFLCRAAARSRAVIPVPSYIDYHTAARQADSAVIEVPLREQDGLRVDLDVIEANLRGDEILFLGQPNNPTGLAIETARIRALARRHPDTLIAVDEAFVDFAADLDSIILELPKNVLVLRSMTKFYAVPGLRVGYAVAEPKLAGRIRELLPPWSLNTFAQEVGRRALTDDDYANRTRGAVAREREHLAAGLADMGGLTVYPGRANFLLVRIDGRKIPAPTLAENLLLNDGIAIRVCDNFSGLDERFFRIAVRKRDENERLLNAIPRAWASS